jgi:hypothetical protein
MWWIWLLIALAVLLVVVFFVSRGKKSPDPEKLRDGRNEPGGGPPWYAGPTDL